jgi:hypothetical protein
MEGRVEGENPLLLHVVFLGHAEVQTPDPNLEDRSSLSPATETPEMRTPYSKNTQSTLEYQVP